MSTLDTPLPSEFAAIRERLEAVGAKFRLAHALGALGRFLALVVPVWTGVVLTVGFFTFPAWLNISLGIAALALAVWAYVRILHRPVFERPAYAQIARWVEMQASEKNLGLQNELINAVLLAEEYGTRSDKPVASWIPHVLGELDRKTASLDFLATVPWRHQRKAWAVAAGALLVSAFLIALFTPTFAHGFAVLFSPAKFVPRTGAVRILSVQPGNDHVLVGAPVNFAVSVEAPDSKIVPVRIDITYASGKHATYPMSIFGSGNSQYKYDLATVAEGLEYMITAGDSESLRFRIDALPEVHLVSYRLATTAPKYTGKILPPLAIAGKDLTAARGSLEVPLGSNVELTVGLDMPVHEALLELAAGNPVALAPAADGKTFTVTLPIRDTVRFAIRANDGAQRTLRRFPDDSSAPNGATAAYFTITALPDQPPTIQVTEPARDLDAKPGDKILLAAQATDDYGLTEIRLETARGTDGAFQLAKAWPVKPAADGKPQVNASLKHELDLPAKDYKFGETLRYRFVAVDNRDLLTINSDLGPQATPGQAFSINFNDTAAAAAKSSKLWDQLRAKLQDLLDRQLKLRQDAANFTPKTTIAEARTLGRSIGDGQKSLRTDLSALAKDFPFESAMKLIQKSLQVMAVGDAVGACDRADDVVLLSDTQALTPLATRLRQHQSRIIDVLQSLLMLSTSEQKRENIVNKEGGDIPNEAKEAWKKLADDLKQFEKQQKQVIDASADLAKKPKDQFDQNDKEKLKNLATIEDKWEKFLAQKLVDLSKITEQDQANVALLEELVQMKVELAMAKDALQTKAVEIATPLEENGLENAKALDTHIERWLQQQPDRQKWQMEEPVGQNETPAAELPKQLQDMVSDLMDNQEDLTDEMESTASKWNDSLNKGAGWDAADGPISNMSAQGVTGNQMPKNMEIQGRSGEGREGRASGEMVGAEAEGKGGRQTPTRMTNEAFSSGKVDDKSKEPVGGATGGGKKGNFGGEGLEGAAPDSEKDPMQRMQGKQAALRNQAERLQLQMHAQGFNNFKLLEAAVLMQKAEDSLKGNRYQNALYYQKQAVQSLNTAKVLAAGQVHVTMDSTPKANEKTQKDIQDALNGVMPKGYSDPVKAYFLKLSTEEGK